MANPRAHGQRRQGVGARRATRAHGNAHSASAVSACRSGFDAMRSVPRSDTGGRRRLLRGRRNAAIAAGVGARDPWHCDLDAHRRKAGLGREAQASGTAWHVELATLGEVAFALDDTEKAAGDYAETIAESRGAAGASSACAASRWSWAWRWNATWHGWT